MKSQIAETRTQLLRPLSQAMALGLGTAAIVAPTAAANSNPATRPAASEQDVATFYQPIHPRMSRAVARVAHQLERRVERQQRVHHAAETAIHWVLRGSKHRLEFETDNPLTAKVDGRERFFTITAAKTVNGQPTQVTVAAIPERGSVETVGCGPPLPPGFQRIYAVSSYDEPIFDLNSAQPKVNELLSNNSSMEIPLAQTRDVPDVGGIVC